MLKSSSPASAHYAIWQQRVLFKKGSLLQVHTRIASKHETQLVCQCVLIVLKEGTARVIAHILTAVPLALKPGGRYLAILADLLAACILAPACMAKPALTRGHGSKPTATRRQWQAAGAGGASLSRPPSSAPIYPAVPMRPVLAGEAQAPLAAGWPGPRPSRSTLSLLRRPGRCRVRGPAFAGSPQRIPAAAETPGCPAGARPGRPNGAIRQRRPSARGAARVSAPESWTGARPDADPLIRV